MPNTLLTISMITRKQLQSLKNNIVFARGADRQYQNQFAIAGAKIGAVLSVRKPAKFRVNDGPTLNVQDYVEESVPLTVDKQKHCDVAFSSVEMTLSLDDWSQRIGEPEAIKLANQIDLDGLGQYWKVSNSLLSPASPNKWYEYAKALALLADESAPMDDRFYICMDQWEQAAIINENKGLFQASTEISAQYKKGMMGTSAGFEWSFDQNVATHLTGARGGTPIVAGGSQSGSSLATSGWTASIPVLKRGDVFQLTGVNAVNTLSGMSTGRLRDFTVLADVTSSGTGTATISISPAILTTPAERATVDALPAASAPMIFLGTPNTLYKQNMAYHTTAFTLATVDLMMPFSGMAARATDPDAGFSLRSWKSSDINTDTHPTRMDVLYGWTAPRPEWAVRIWSVRS